MQKIMRSLFIATLLLVSMGMGAYAQETKKTFTPEQQEMIDLSNAKWKWMSEKDVDKLDALFHVNPAKRNVMVVKNEMRLLKQKRNVLQI